MATLVVLSGNTRAQQDDVWSVVENTGLFRANVSIEKQRERSTENFELLDADRTGSITLPEIDFSLPEEDRAEMTREEQFERS